MHESGPVPPGYNDAKQFKVCQTDSWLLSVSEPNNCVQINKEVFRVRNILKALSNEIHIVLEPYREVSCFSDFPSDCLTFGIYLVDNLSRLLTVAPLSTISKCVCLPFKRKFVVFPLSHS